MEKISQHQKYQVELQKGLGFESAIPWKELFCLKLCSVLRLFASHSFFPRPVSVITAVKLSLLGGLGLTLLISNVLFVELN